MCLFEGKLLSGVLQSGLEAIFFYFLINVCVRNSEGITVHLGYIESDEQLLQYSDTRYDSPIFTSLFSAFSYHPLVRPLVAAALLQKPPMLWPSSPLFELRYLLT